MLANLPSLFSPLIFTYSFCYYFSTSTKQWLMSCGSTMQGSAKSKHHHWPEMHRWKIYMPLCLIKRTFTEDWDARQKQFWRTEIEPWIRQSTCKEEIALVRNPVLVILMLISQQQHSRWVLGLYQWQPVWANPIVWWCSPNVPEMKRLRVLETLTSSSPLDACSLWITALQM